MFNKIILFLLFFSITGENLHAQDPHFTQFQNSPLTFNPAQTGLFTTRLTPTHIRILSNYRRQWYSSQSPFNTATIQFDTKIAASNEEDDFDKPNLINFGIVFMYDQSLNGLLKGNYFMATGSLHKILEENDGSFKSLGLGFGACYGNRRVDLSQISFSQQFTSGGFDLNLPNGEPGLTDMKPYLSLNAGLVYQSTSGEYNQNEFKFGVSGFHLNKPKQTFSKDPLQVLPMRFSAQLEYLTRNTRNFNYLETKIIYQKQAAINYLQLSAIYNVNIGGSDMLNSIGFGANYRLNSVISPYLAVAITGFRFGCSYDITTTKLKSGLSQSRSMEFSLQLIFPK